MYVEPRHGHPAHPSRSDFKLRCLRSIEPRSLSLSWPYVVSTLSELSPRHQVAVRPIETSRQPVMQPLQPHATCR